MNTRKPIVALLLASGVAVAGASACSDPAAGTSCGEIPDGGCPDDYDADYCGDPTCAAVYTCASGAWTQVQACPAHPSEAGPDTADVEASPTSDVRIDAPAGAFGGPGCVDLETPDCSVGTALLCSGATDCCGCADLYVCVGGGWSLWGQCTDAGVVAGP